jgi:hypothetical protein
MSEAANPNDQELMTVADSTLPGGSASPMDPSADSPTEVVDLGEDPFDDDLAGRLKARTPLKLTSRTTLALSGTVLIVLGFIGGVLVQKNFGTTSTSTNNRGAALANGFNGANGAGGGAGGAAAGGGAGGGGAGAGGGGAGAGGGGAGAGGAAGRNATTGTVKLVDGTTIYLTTANGDTVTVKTSGTTTVRVLQTGSAKDIPVGATVVVQGTADADGIITATQVTAQK